MKNIKIINQSLLGFCHYFLPGLDSKTFPVFDQYRVNCFFDYIKQQSDNPLTDYRKHNISYNSLSDYKNFRNNLDTGYIMLNKIFRNFYTDYFLNDLNKKIHKNAKEANIKINADIIMQKAPFIQYIYKTYNPYLPEFPLRNKGKENFTHLFESILIKNTSSWMAFIKNCEKSYPSLVNKTENPKYPVTLNLTLQTTQYIEQITIYLSFILYLIDKHPNIPFKDFCKSPILYDLYVNYELNEEQTENIKNTKIL